MSMETPTRRSEKESLLSVDSLDVKFAVEDGTIDALRDVSLDVQKGETVGLAGESGSGKSTLALAIVQYLDANGWSTAGRLPSRAKTWARRRRANCAPSGATASLTSHRIPHGR